MSKSVQSIKLLHEKTGAGYLDAKKALEKTNGSVQQAADLLREKGLSAARKKSARLTNTGIVETYVHTGNRIGVIVELYCETDFASSSEAFRNFAHNIAMHIAAMNPSSVDDLLQQGYYRDPDQRVSEILLECVAALKENVTIKKFSRYEVGL
jgi:elongation factor Ts